MELNEKFINALACPLCKEDIFLVNNNILKCKKNHQYSLIKNIPRFVENDKYVKSFSLEWSKHFAGLWDAEFPSKNEIDVSFVPFENYTRSFNNKWKKNNFISNWNIDNKSESYDTFYCKTGIKPEELKGCKILEIGCGNGRFLDVLSKSGAVCYGMDLSLSVESAYNNLKNRENVFIVQGDLNHPPFKENFFDFVYSIGVLHHTPSVRQAVKNISNLVKKDKMMAIWIYGKTFQKNLGNFWWHLLKRLPHPILYRICKSAKYLYYIYNLPIIGYVRAFFPIAMHPNADFRVLGTFDSYSPKYAFKTSYLELAKYFEENGYKNIELGIFPTSVRGIKKC